MPAASNARYRGKGVGLTVIDEYGHFFQHQPTRHLVVATDVTNPFSALFDRPESPTAG